MVVMVLKYKKLGILCKLKTRNTNKQWTKVMIIWNAHYNKNIQFSQFWCLIAVIYHKITFYPSFLSFVLWWGHIGNLLCVRLIHVSSRSSWLYVVTRYASSVGHHLHWPRNHRCRIHPYKQGVMIISNI